MVAWNSFYCEVELRVINYLKVKKLMLFSIAYNSIWTLSYEGFPKYYKISRLECIEIKRGWIYIFFSLWMVSMTTSRTGLSLKT